MRTTLLTTSPQEVQESLFSEMCSFTKTCTPQAGRLGFAFVTHRGAKELVERLSCNEWDDLSKDFVVGIGNGITEPRALRLLRQLKNSKVRVFVPTRQLEKSSLMSNVLFHPKTVMLQNFSSKRHFLYCGSHNLTGAAVGAQPTNHEIGLATLLRDSSNDRNCIEKFNRWWDELENRCRVANDYLISRYAKLRSSQFMKNPDLASSISILSNIDDINEAKELWIEVGKGSGSDRHQVEFPYELARFFASPKKARIDLTLRSRGRTWEGRPLTWKKTTPPYGVDIWRLGMPTIRKNGEEVRGRYIKFSRTRQSKAFNFLVTDEGSNELDRWVNSSSKNGTIGTTSSSRSGRKYGFN